MHIPDELTVFGRSYQVRNTSPIHDLEGVLGAASYRNGFIYLHPCMDMTLALSALWHEVANIAQQDLFGSIDEVKARWIALFVHNFLVNNPEILDCYRYGLEDRNFDDDDNR